MTNGICFYIIQSVLLLINIIQSHDLLHL